MGAVVGAIVGAPLGFLMGIIGGAINRRWGWTIGGALPGLILTLLVRQGQLNRLGHINEMGSWYIICLGIVPFASGALAGGRLGRFLERSDELRYKRHRAITQENIARIPIGIRLGLVAIFLLSLTDLGIRAWHTLDNL